MEYPVNSSNASSSVCSDMYTDNSIIAKTLAYMLILVLSLTGNLFVIFNVIHSRNLTSPTSVLIMNMAISDMFIPLLAMPREVYEIVSRTEAWRVQGTAGLVLCKVLFYLTDISPLVSVLSLCGIAIERFTVVVFPLNWSLRSQRRVNRAFIASTWIIPALFTAHYLHTFQLIEFENQVYCELRWGPTFNEAHAHRIYVVLLCVLFYIVPFTLMTVLYAEIVRQLGKPPFRSSPSAHVQQQRYNVTKLAISICSAFVMCWTPFYIWLLLSIIYATPLSGIKCGPQTFVFVAKTMAYSNAAVNPCIYFSFVMNSGDNRQRLRALAQRQRFFSLMSRTSRRIPKRHVRVGIVEDNV